ncbi:MAG: hypothetical protein WCF23_24695 [Candidatus Nitrosopolaris sp.]
MVSRQRDNNTPDEKEIACNRELLVPATERSSLQYNTIHESSTRTRSKPRCKHMVAAELEEPHPK